MESNSFLFFFRGSVETLNHQQEQLKRQLAEQRLVDRQGQREVASEISAVGDQPDVQSSGLGQVVMKCRFFTKLIRSCDQPKWSWIESSWFFLKCKILTWMVWTTQPKHHGRCLGCFPRAASTPCCLKRAVKSRWGLKEKVGEGGGGWLCKVEGEAPKSCWSDKFVDFDRRKVAGGAILEFHEGLSVLSKWPWW